MKTIFISLADARRRAIGLLALTTVVIAAGAFLFLGEDRSPLQSLSSQGYEVIIKDADSFDGDILSPRWGGFGVRPPLEGGVVRMDGTGGWNTGIERSGFRANEGIMINFHFSPGTNFGMFFQAGLFDSEDWRQIGMESIDGSERTYANWGTGGPNWTLLEDGFLLDENVWYTLVHRVLLDGRFSTQIWKYGDPGEYIFNSVTVPPDTVDWDARTWLFTISIKSGTLRLDNYRELQFPSNFEMPESPPG